MNGMTVALPPELVAEVDRWAERLDETRESLLCQAVREWAARQQEEFEALLAEGYQSRTEELRELADEVQLVQAAATEGIWRWDG